MKLSFRTKKIESLCRSEREAVRALGPECAKKLGARMLLLDGAADLSSIGKVPSAACHELTGDRKGQLAVALKHPYRLIFRPDHDPVPCKPDGGLDWTQVTAILIEEVVDYH